VDVVHPLMRNSSRGGLLVLSSFSRRSPYEAPPHEGLLCWASVVGLPLGRSWAVKGAQEQVDRDTPVSRTPTQLFSNWATTVFYLILLSSFLFNSRLCHTLKFNFSKKSENVFQS
jgi:hypothetical protein